MHWQVRIQLYIYIRLRTVCYRNYYAGKYPGSSKENYSCYWPAIKDINKLFWPDINH